MTNITIIRFVGAVLLSAMLASAQSSTRIVSLAWEDVLNPAGTAYNVYRAPGQCSTSSVFSMISSGITLKTYDDTGLSTGTYCYHVTATANGLESLPSNTASAKVLPHPPTKLTVLVK